MVEENDPRYHVEKMKARLRDHRPLARRCGQSGRPAFQGDVRGLGRVGGLVKSFNDFEGKDESAWKALTMAGAAAPQHSD